MKRISVLGFFAAYIVAQCIVGYCDNEMTEKLRKKILHGHNIRRAKLALGSVTQFDCSQIPGAAKMTRLAYDCNLEKSAKKWSDNCEFKHSVGSHGENLYMVWPPPPLYKTVQQSIEAWWDNELNALNQSLPNKLNMDFFNSSKAGHFTQMSTDAIHSVGCGGTICPKLGYFFVCHYNQRQFFERPVFEYGRQCSKCSGKCRKLKGLCNAKRLPRSTAAIEAVDDENVVITKPTKEHIKNKKNQCKIYQKPTVGSTKMKLQRISTGKWKTKIIFGHNLCNKKQNSLNVGKQQKEKIVSTKMAFKPTTIKTAPATTATTMAATTTETTTVATKKSTKAPEEATTKKKTLKVQKVIKTTASVRYKSTTVFATTTIAPRMMKTTKVTSNLAAITATTLGVIDSLQSYS